jgi:uncharacterized SAM-binding protein YcdF (DUF218 family)
MKLLIFIPVVIALLIVSLSLFLQPNDFIGCEKTPDTFDARCNTADAIVVVSGGDTSARTAEGIALYKAGWAENLIFSGAAKDTEGPSNAEVMRMQALARGVPADAILIEDLSVNTQQNAINTQEILASNNFNEVILVTSGYHQKRASLEFEKRAEGVRVVNHPLLNDRDWSGWWWLTPRGWWLTVSEVIKIGVFYAGGTSE